MPVQYFPRETDPLQTVYEVDFDAGTWPTVGCRLDIPHSSGELLDGGKAFHSVYFRRVEIADETEDSVTFRRVGTRTIH